MGTSAQLMIQATRPGINYKFRIGMDRDGCEYNLTILATEVMQAAKEMRCLTKFKRKHLPTVKKVLQTVVDRDHNKGWFYTTEDAVPFTGFTGILDAATGKVGIYSGDFESFIKSEKIE